MTEQTGTVTCKYPGCDQPARTAPKTGRRPEYCDNPEHSALKAWRERQRLEAEQGGTAYTAAQAEQPITMARVHGADMLREVQDLAGKLTAAADRLTGTVATLGDTTRSRGRSRCRPESSRAARRHRRGRPGRSRAARRHRRGRPGRSRAARR